MNNRYGVSDMLFEKIEPMLPMGKNVNYVERLFIDWENVLASPKIDGIHVLVHKLDDQVKIFTRNYIDLTQKFPSLVDSLRKQSVHSFVLDGELISIDNKTIMPFNEIQRKIVGNETTGLGKPCVLVFDALFIEKNITHLPFYERYLNMKNSINNNGIYIIPQTKIENAEKLQEMYKKTLVREFEGLMLRDSHAPYEFGRSFALRKMKPIDFAELTIVKKELIGNYGVYSLTDKNGIVTKARDAREFKLGDVVEVAFEKKFRNGKLKFPRIVRMRIDKTDVSHV